METFKPLLLLLLIASGFFSCKKEWDINNADSFYIQNIYEDDILKYHFAYENRTLVYVCRYSGESTDTFFIDPEDKLRDELVIKGNNAFEYDDQGRCIKITYYKSIPDSIFCYLNLSYESNNLSKIDWYGGDGNYVGNLTYQYDTVSNPLYVLNTFIEPNFYDYWKYQPNHCISQQSDVKNEGGLAWFEYSFSFETQSPTKIWILYLYHYSYTYTEYGLPAQAIYYNSSEPEKFHYLRFLYVEL